MSLDNSEKNKKTVASIISWQQVCKMLDKVQEGAQEKKKELLLKFINQYRDLLTKNKACPDDSFFPVLRILLPDLDRDRGAYGIKEHKLAELYIRIFGLRKESVDAQRLIHFRKPKSGGKIAGDFSEVAFHALKTRSPEKGVLTLQDVESHLTTIAESHASKNQDEVERCFLYMVRKMTANEQKWLTRVLLKDMRLGIGQTSIFSAWHPDAKDYYDVTNSLSKVCSTLQNPSVRLHEIEVSLFLPFRPMLAERIVLEKVETQMKNKVFFVETKFDGERSQIHKKGPQYKYFSRNGFDFTVNFGPTPSTGIFTPYLHPRFAPHVKEAIVDGEIICWSKKYSTFVTKGQNTDVKNLKDEGDWQVCFCAFDILYLNGKVLTNLPLSERLSELAKTLVPLEGRVHVTSHSEVGSKEDVVKALNLAIDNQEEGVVLKDPSSVYRPAARKAGWIKVKPEYVDSCVPELDLLIIGGYYGTGRRGGGTISHFLLAVAETNPESTQTFHFHDSRPKEFHSFCRSGSGFTMAELEDLNPRLAKCIVQNQPPNVCVGREKPDVWYIPEKSFVVQVKAAEIVKSELYHTRSTLRFPRVEKIRFDKSWFEILTANELRELVQESSGKLASKLYLSGDKGESPMKKVLRQSQQPSLPEILRPADVSNVVLKSALFSGKEFCILGGAEGTSKHQLETLVAEHGGTFSQHPGKKTFCIICNKMSVHVQNMINCGLYNIVKPSWILDCIAERRLLPWGPIETLHLLPKEAKNVAAAFDQFGDSFYEPTNAHKLKAVMDAMNQNGWTECTRDEEAELDLLTTNPGDLRSLFRRVKAHFLPEAAGDYVHPTPTRLRFTLYGGAVNATLNDDTTHVVVDKGIKGLRPSEFPGKHVVSEEWITKSIEEGKLESERLYGSLERVTDLKNA